MLFKKFKSKLAIPLVLSLCLVNLMQLIVAGEETYIVNENFDAGLGAWAESAGANVRSSTVVSHENGAMKLTTTILQGLSAEFNQEAALPINPTITLADGEKLAVEFKIKVDGGKSRRTFVLNGNSQQLIAFDGNNGNQLNVNGNVAMGPVTAYVPGQWYSFRLIMPKAGSGEEYDIYIDDKLYHSQTMPTNSYTNGYNYIGFYNRGSGNGNAPVQGDTIITYIDDIKLYKLTPLKVSSQTIQNGETVSPTDQSSSMSITFDKELDSQTINKNNIKVISNQLDTVNYTVEGDSSNSNTCKITFTDGFKQETRYTVLVSGVKSTDNSMLAESNWQTSFNTGGSYEFCSFEVPSNGFSIDGFSPLNTNARFARPNVTTKFSRSGNNSLEIATDVIDYRYALGTEQTNKVVTMWMYDSLGNQETNTRFYASVDSLAGSDIYGVGMYTDASVYGKRWGSYPNEGVTEISRTKGWHQLKWKIDSGNGMTVYIDNEEVFAVPEKKSFKGIRFVDDWPQNDIGTGFYFDDVEIRDINLPDFKLNTQELAGIKPSTTNIPLIFSNPINQNTLDNITIWKKVGGDYQKIETAIEIDATNNNICNISPAASLKEGQYKVSVNPGLRDTSGVRIDNPKDLEFEMLQQLSLVYEVKAGDTVNYNVVPGVLNCKVTITDNYSEPLPTSVAFIAVLYKDGDVYDVDFGDKFEGNGQLTATVTAPDDLGDGVYTLKLLVWDGFSNIGAFERHAPIKVLVEQ